MLNIPWAELFAFLLSALDKCFPTQTTEGTDATMSSVCDQRYEAARNPFRRRLAIRRGLIKLARLRGRELWAAVDEVEAAIEAASDDEWRAFCSVDGRGDEP